MLLDRFHVMGVLGRAMEQLDEDSIPVSRVFDLFRLVALVLDRRSDVIEIETMTRRCDQTGRVARLLHYILIGSSISPPIIQRRGKHGPLRRIGYNVAGEGFIVLYEPASQPRPSPRYVARVEECDIVH